MGEGAILGNLGGALNPRPDEVFSDKGPMRSFLIKARFEYFRRGSCFSRRRFLYQFFCGPLVRLPPKPQEQTGEGQKGAAMGGKNIYAPS